MSRTKLGTSCFIFSNGHRTLFFRLVDKGGWLYWCKVYDFACSFLKTVALKVGKRVMEKDKRIELSTITHLFEGKVTPSFERKVHFFDNLCLISEHLQCRWPKQLSMSTVSPSAWHPLRKIKKNWEHHMISHRLLLQLFEYFSGVALIFCLALCFC